MKWNLLLPRLLGAGLVVALNAASPSTDWSQWRGPQRDGQFAGPTWPDSLSTNQLRQIWRVKLGPSYSGPITAGSRVFTTETRDKKFEVVTAFDRETGRPLWKAEWPGAMSVPFFAKSNGDWIRSTPTSDNESLFVAGMRDVLVCLDISTGQERWRKDFVSELKTPNPDFGFVCSPLVDDDSVYVQAGASLARLDKRTGKLLWRTLQDQGGTYGSAFSSPIFATLAGQRQIVVQTREKLAGVNPSNGQVLWAQPIEAFRGMNILTPVIHEDTVFTSTYGGKTLGLKITAPGGNFSATPAWTHKSQGYMSTPVLVDGVAYHHLKSQRAMAIEVATGRELWTTDQSFGKYWSLVAQKDRLLALDQSGTLFLLRANRQKFDLIDSRKLSDEETWAHIAVAGDQIFIRELRALTAYRWTSNGSAAAPGRIPGESAGTNPLAGNH